MDVVATTVAIVEGVEMNYLGTDLPVRRVVAFLSVAVVSVFAVFPASRAAADGPDPMVERGRYLVQIAGCNDCHTPGYMESAGQVDEKLWLTGSQVGWNGPWGTTYPPNLRLIAQTLSEDQWVVTTRNQWRPPMPWYELRHMKDDDVKAIWHYLRFVGPAGSPAPAALPPGVVPQGPLFHAPAPPPPAKQ